MTNRHLEETRHRIAAAHLYLIAGPPRDGSDSEMQDWVRRIRSACEGGVEIVQLRFKERSTSEVVQAAAKLKAIREEFGVVLIVNDDVEAAVASGVEGVHVGQDDLPIEAVRERVGSRMQIGVSTHSLDQAIDAERRGADHLGFGAMFETATKSKLELVSPLALGPVLRRVRIPLFAIGGIRAGNLDSILATGARRIAVSSAILEAPDPRTAAAELSRRLRGAKESD